MSLSVYTVYKKAACMSMSTVCPENVRHCGDPRARAGPRPAPGGAGPRRARGRPGGARRGRAGARRRAGPPAAAGHGGHHDHRAGGAVVWHTVGPGRGGSVRMCCDSHVDLDCPRQDDDERHDY